MEEQPTGRDVGGQIRDLARVLREQWWIILLCVVLTTFAAAALTSTQKKEYEATAKLLLQPDNFTATFAGAAVPGVDPTRQAATDAQLVGLPAVAQRVTKKLKQPLRTAAVRTSSAADSNILSVTVTDHDPKRAARFANEFAQQYIGFRRDSTRQRYQRALSAVQTRIAQTRRGTPDYATLSAQAKQLRLLVSLQTGDAQVVAAARPPANAVRPEPARNIAIGVVFGLLLGLALAFLRDRLDRRVKDENQLESMLPGVPLVGLVPEPRRGRAARLMTAEGYHTLYANLSLLGRDRPLKTILVTSASPGDGKSTVALNLALAMIERGATALVVDADLRRPSITQSLKADSRIGVSSILAGKGSLSTSVQEANVEPARNGDGPTISLGGALPVVSAGPAPSNVQLLLSDRALGSLVEETKERNECVIFDGPPVGSFSDMLPLAREVDGVIAVARLYHSRSDELRRFAMQLENAGIKLLGVVVLGTSHGRTRYYAEYLKR